MDRYAMLKQRVYAANMKLTELGLVILTWGNVSEIDRENGVVAIKPRGIEYADLTPEDISLVDLDGHPLESGLLPSVDLDIHLELYRNFPGIGGIAHTHSTWATAWAQRGIDLPVCGTTHADHFYGDIPCVPYPSPEQTDEEGAALGYAENTSWAGKNDWAGKIEGLYVNNPDQYQFWPIWQTFIDNSNGMLVNSSNYQ